MSYLVKKMPHSVSCNSRGIVSILHLRRIQMLNILFRQTKSCQADRLIQLQHKANSEITISNNQGRNATCQLCLVDVSFVNRCQLGSGLPLVLPRCHGLLVSSLLLPDCRIHRSSVLSLVGASSPPEARPVEA